MAHEFVSNRSLSAEARLRRLEDYLAESFRLDTAAEEAADTLGGGAAAVAAGGGGGGGGSGSVTLLGDVTGPAGANVVDRIEGTQIPAPVAGDDEKFIKYQHATPAFEYSHIDRIQNVPIAAPTAADDERSVAYDHDTIAFVYRPGLTHIVCTDDDVVVNDGEVVWLP